MITLLPAHHETIVLPISAQEAYERLTGATSRETTPDPHIVFYGWVQSDRFRVTWRQGKSSNFSPIISGEIEPTNHGCIVLVDYKLMPSIRLIVTFWSLLIFIGVLITGFQFKNILYTIGGVAFVAIMYAVVWANFKLHQQPARKALTELFFP